MNKSKIIVREGAIRDIAVIRQLHKELMEYHLTFDSSYKLTLDSDSAFESYAKHLVESEDNHIVVALVDGEIAGFASGGLQKRPPIYHVRKMGCIEMVFVQSEYCRCEIGRALVEDICKWLKKSGVTWVELNVNYLNAETIKTWKSLGFKEFSLRMKRKL